MGLRSATAKIILGLSLITQYPLQAPEIPAATQGQARIAYIHPGPDSPDQDLDKNLQATLNDEYGKKLDRINVYRRNLTPSEKNGITQADVPSTYAKEVLAVAQTQLTEQEETGQRVITDLLKSYADNDLDDVVREFWRRRIPSTFIEEVTEAARRNPGVMLSTKGIVHLWRNGEGAAELGRVARARNAKGERLLVDAGAVYRYLESGASLKDLFTYAGSVDSPAEITRRAWLGDRQTIEGPFTDTNKPNALLVIPSILTDQQSAFLVSAYNNAGYDRAIERTKWRELWAHYDVRTVFTDDSAAIVDAAKKMGRVDLLYLNGHGTATDLTLGSATSADSPHMQARRTIGIAETHLGTIAENMSRGAPIVLASCLTGSGGAEGKNLANHVAKLFPSHKVYSPMEPTTTLEQATTFGPFETRFFHGGKDITYVANYAAHARR